MSETDNRSELLTKLRQHADKVDDVRHYCTNEANTRGALVEPLLGILGYDYTDPREVVREFTADVAGKKGEKVDYALMRDGEPVVLVEAKTLGNRLGGSEREQLQRYFPFTLARLAVLTDGIRWHWYKGRSERDQSHQMESSPFLAYDAREPTTTAAEWLTQLTKDGFNPDGLLRIARRIDFTDRIGNWIYRAFVNPTETGARQVNEVAGLDATDDELSLVIESIQSAWVQMIGGQVGVVPHAEESDDDAGHSASSTDSTSSIQSGQPNIEESSSAFNGDDTELQFVSHRDERLDLCDGRVLDSNRLARAWRMGDGDWIKEKNATEMTLAALGELLRCDRRRDDEQGLAESLGLHYDDMKPNNRKLRPIPGFSNIYWNMDLNNDWKARLLKGVASKVQFNPPPDSPLAKLPRIEWWLPNKPKR